jgi:hypothetical protein
LYAITSALPASSTAFMIRRSCSVIGPEASITTTTTSARSIAALVRSEA